MASLIKNQILKHLSKFVKNLNVDQISVEVLRGRGELSNLELNEQVLTEVFDLPSWLKIKKAVCSRVAVKVPWTKLKTEALRIVIDEISVEVEMSSNLRPSTPGNAQTTTPNNDSSSWYSSFSGGETSSSYATRVLEGMSIFMNSLEVFFISEVFRGSVTLSRLCVESRTPMWQKAQNLRQTRLKDYSGHNLIIFKEMDWEALRIEASSVGEPGQYGDNTFLNAPLRLITSHGRTRVAIKKLISDGSVLTARLQLLLDGILWVATLPQLRSAVAFYRYIISLVQKAAEQAKNESRRAEKQIEMMAQKSRPPPAQIPQQTASKKPTQNPTSPPQVHPHNNVQAVFERFDVVETSYHFYAGHIDLHVCDDSKSTDIKFPADWNIENGAVQLTFERLACDIYPYHLATADRKYWVHYKETKAQSWVEDLLGHYYQELVLKFAGTQALGSLKENWPKLMSNCCVLRLEDLTINCLWTPAQGQQAVPEKLISSDRQAFHLPQDMPILHMELSDYYYPSKTNLPVPPRSTYMQGNPVRVYVDSDTLRWLHYVYLDICNRLGLKSESVEALPHGDVRIQLLMPRIVIPAAVNEVCAAIKKPKQLHLQCSTAVITNCAVGDGIQCTGLKDLLAKLIEKPLFCYDPSTSKNDSSHPLNLFDRLPSQTQPVKQYLTTLSEPRGSDAKYTTFERKKIQQDAFLGQDLTDLLTKRSVDDVWTISASPFWADFIGDKLYYPKPMPFVLDASLTIYALNHFPLRDVQGVQQVEEKLCADMYLLIAPQGSMKLALDHYQYLFFVHTMQHVSDFVALLDADLQIFAKNPAAKSTCMGFLAPWVEVSFILPIQAPISPYDETPQVQDGAEHAATESGLGDDVSGSQEMCNNCNSSSPRITHSSLGLEGESVLVMPGSTGLPNVASEPAFGLKQTHAASFSSLMDSPQMRHKLASNELDVDQCSVDDAMSTVSDSDFDAVLIDAQEASPFEQMFENVPATAEEAAEAVDAFNEREINLRILHEHVALVTVKLADLEMLMLAHGQDSVTLLQAPHCTIEESGPVVLNDLHVALAGKTPVPGRSDGIALTDFACVKSTSEQYPLKLELGKTGEFVDGYMKGKFTGLKLSLNNATLANLTGFLQDDKPDQPIMPIHIVMEDATLCIKDPKQPAPVKLSVDHAVIAQGQESSSSITTAGFREVLNPDTLRTSPQESLEQENQELRRRLQEAKLLIQKLAKENYNIRLE